MFLFLGIFLLLIYSTKFSAFFCTFAQILLTFFFFSETENHENLFTFSDHWQNVQRTTFSRLSFRFIVYSPRTNTILCFPQLSFKYPANSFAFAKLSNLIHEDLKAQTEFLLNFSVLAFYASDWSKKKFIFIHKAESKQDFSKENFFVYVKKSHVVIFQLNPRSQLPRCPTQQWF